MAESRPFESYRSTNTLVNALVGGILSLVLAFLPLSPVLGGAVSGYLQQGDRRGGLRVGAFAGLVMLVPALLFGFLFLAVLAGGFAVGAGRVSAFFILFTLAIGVITVFYTVGLSAAGGYLGVLVAEHYEK